MFNARKDIYIMAKVTGPLYSMSASGKLADAMVYFGWKGVNVVRGWVKPANPQSSAQGNQRIVVGGTGRSVGEIKPSMAFAQQLIDLGLIPGGQTKQSFMVKYIIDHYINNATNYAAELALCTGHTAYTSFGALADTLGVVEFDLSYAGNAPYDKALGLFLIAKTAIALSFVGTPYDTALSSWTSTEVLEMGANFTAT